MVFLAQKLDYICTIIDIIDLKIFALCQKGKGAFQKWFHDTDEVIIFLFDSNSSMKVMEMLQALTAENPNFDWNYFSLFISALSKLCLTKKKQNIQVFHYALDLNDIIPYTSLKRTNLQELVAHIYY